MAEVDINSASPAESSPSPDDSHAASTDLKNYPSSSEGGDNLLSQLAGNIRRVFEQVNTQGPDAFRDMHPMLNIHSADKPKDDMAKEKAMAEEAGKAVVKGLIKGG